jgi:hypothetical protein
MFIIVMDYQVYSPYGNTTPDLTVKNDRYLRHRDWIEPVITEMTQMLSKTHIRTCECGSNVRLTSGIIRRHLASEKHLKFIAKWTEDDERELSEFKKKKVNKTK